MGLQDQVAADVKGEGKAADEGSASASGWSPRAEERERNLRARKEKLVLEARRCVCFPSYLVAAPPSGDSSPLRVMSVCADRAFVPCTQKAVGEGSAAASGSRRGSASGRRDVVGSGALPGLRMGRLLAFLLYPGNIISKGRRRAILESHFAAQKLPHARTFGSADSRLSCWCSACEPET